MIISKTKWVDVCNMLQEIRNSLVKINCNVCGIQVNLSPDLESPVCQTKNFALFIEIIP